VFTVARSLLTLTTAGPNSKIQLVGYPIDAKAFIENPTLYEHFKKFSLLSNCSSLLRKLNNEMAIPYEGVSMPQ
jgi:hypothetical protein